jgi:hypothetical protein
MHPSLGDNSMNVCYTLVTNMPFFYRLPIPPTATCTEYHSYASMHHLCL